MNSASAKRIDIISDTHGYLSPALLDELEGADLIIHAGDLTSEMDYEHLRTIAPVRAVLGNNDYYCDYGPTWIAWRSLPTKASSLPWPTTAKTFRWDPWT